MMKKLLTCLAVSTALLFGGLAIAQDKAAAPADAKAAVSAPADAKTAAPAAKPTEEVKKPKFDKGDTAWMMTATMLVILMTLPGLALFYGGMVI